MTYNPKKAKSCNRTGAGRPAELRTISSYEAKQEALLMIRRGKFKANTKLYSVIGLLGTTGVLPEEQLTELGHVTARGSGVVKWDLRICPFHGKKSSLSQR